MRCLVYLEGMELQTAHLRMVARKQAHLDASAAGLARLAEAMGAIGVAEGFPVFPEELAHKPSINFEFSQGFGLYYLVHRTDGLLIGSAGLYGPPDALGEVQAGFSIVPSYRRKGLASEALKGLIDFCRASGMVKAIVTNTLAGDEASGGVMLLVGLRPEGQATTDYTTSDGKIAIQRYRLEL